MSKNNTPTENHLKNTPSGQESERTLPELLKRRVLFLGRIIDGALILLGIALIITVLGRLLGFSDTELSVAQQIQGLVGALCVAAGITRQTTSLLLNKVLSTSLRRVIGLFPILAMAIFLPFRLQITDIESYARCVGEGSLFEWLSFMFLLLAGVLFVLSGRNERRGPPAQLAKALGVATLVIAMEEMSWGQMIFNWNTPALFMNANRQEETNLHNLVQIHGSTWTIAAVVFSFLSLLCILRWWLERQHRLASPSIADALLPCPLLLGYFGIAALIYIGVVIEKQGIDIPILITREQEIAECLFALGVLIHSCRTYLHWGLPRQRKSN